jgi:N-acyl-D-aspartate/D-glutamate deacylase
MKLIRPLRLLFLVTGFVLLLRLISIPARAADAEYDLIMCDGRVMDGSGRAQIMGISYRGRLAVGNWVGITIFDPDTTAGKSNFPGPHQYSAGVVGVMVNGVAALEDGKMSGALPGKLVLRRH